jgi:hypothetical protein
MHDDMRWTFFKQSSQSQSWRFLLRFKVLRDHLHVRDSGTFLQWATTSTALLPFSIDRFVGNLSVRLAALPHSTFGKSCMQIKVQTSSPFSTLSKKLLAF